MLHVKPQVAINTPFHFQNPVEEQHKMYVSLQTANGFSQKIIRKIDISKFIGEVYYVFYIFVGSTKNALIRVILWVRTRQQLI